MFPSAKYPPDDGAADRFLAEARQGTLIACPPDGHPQVSVLPFVLEAGVIELHAVQGDPTLDAVRITPRATFLVADHLTWTPHDWVSERDAGQATLHFRAVALECAVERVSTDPADVAAALSRLLARYEPGAVYEPIADGRFYGDRLRRLATIRLRVERRHVKFKTGPARADELKRTLARRLLERAEPGDARAAAVIESSIGGEPGARRSP